MIRKKAGNLGKKEKLLHKLLSNPRDFTFDEMKNVLTFLGFTMSNKGKTSGSRVKFFNDDIIIILHKPHPRKELLEYQIKEIIDTLERNGLL